MADGQIVICDRYSFSSWRSKDGYYNITWIMLRASVAHYLITRLEQLSCFSITIFSTLYWPDQQINRFSILCDLWSQYNAWEQMWACILTTIKRAGHMIVWIEDVFDHNVDHYDQTDYNVAHWWWCCQYLAWHLTCWQQWRDRTLEHALTSFGVTKMESKVNCEKFWQNVLTEKKSWEKFEGLS